MTQHESAKPCGCDAGAKWTCAFHKLAEANRHFVFRGPTAEELEIITRPDPYIQDLPDLSPALRLPEVLEPAEPVMSYGDCPTCDGYLLDPTSKVCTGCQIAAQWEGQQDDPRRI